MEHPILHNQFSENNLTLTNEQLNLAFELEQLNEVFAPFKLSDVDIARWVKRISEVKPDMTPEKLNVIVLNFITGKFIYNKNLGIANIFNPKERKDEYSLACPEGSWTGYLTESEFKAKTVSGYWKLKSEL